MSLALIDGPRLAEKPSDVEALAKQHQQYLQSVGYVRPASAQREKLSKAQQLERQQKQIQNLQEVMARHNAEIEKVKEQNRLDTIKKMQNLKRNLENNQQAQKKKMLAIQAKTVRQRENQKRVAAQYEEERRQMEFNFALQEARVQQLENQRVKDKLDAMQVGQEKTKQIRMRTDLAKQLIELKEHKAEENWKAWVARMKINRKFVHESHVEQLNHAYTGYEAEEEEPVEPLRWNEGYY